MIARCPHCQKKLDIADDLAGKQVRCANPACQKAFTVPAAAVSAAPPPVPKTPPIPTTPSPPVSSVPPPPPPPSSPPAQAQSPAAPPPMPASAPPPPTATEAKSAQDILSGYQATSQDPSAAHEVGGKIKAGAKSIKKRAQAIKLKRDVHNLQNALKQQMEILGTLTLQHQPEKVQITAELNKLSQIQNQLSEKQTTLSSLQQTSGSKKVVKQMKQEIHQLQGRQKELMVAIGIKTDAARPDLPGVAGNYGAIDQLRSTLQPKQAELEQLQAEIGPIADKETLSSASSLARKYAPISIGAIAAILILYFGIGWIWGLIFPGGWKEFQYYIPDEVTSIQFADLQEMREHDELEDNVNSIINESLGMVKNYLDIDEDEIEKVLQVASQKGSSFLVIKTAKDSDLEDVIKNFDDKNMETYKDIDYAKLGRGYSGCLAKTAKKTYLFTTNKDSIEETLKQYLEKEKPDFDEDFQAAFDEVDTYDQFLVSVGSKKIPAVSSGFVVTSGIFGSAFKEKTVTIFDKEKDAEETYEDAEKNLERKIEDLEKEIERGDNKKRKKALEAQLKLAKSTSIKLKGNEVIESSKIDLEDLEDLEEPEGM